MLSLLSSFFVRYVYFAFCFIVIGIIDADEIVSAFARYGVKIDKQEAFTLLRRYSFSVYLKVIFIFCDVILSIYIISL